MDNALDACEEVEVAPVISIDVKDGSITIQDNAGGIDPATIESILDYTIRVSSREAYCSPTRGAQGNALKTILAMAFVLQREVINEDNPEADAAGVTIIETRGLRHRIEFSVDHINNQPKIAHDISPSSIEIGTKVTVEWPPKWEWSQTAFKSLARSYAWVNPHLTLRGTFDGEVFVDVAATDPAWKKWNRAIRPRRIGIARRGSNVISPPMWRGTAISGSTVRSGSSFGSFAAFPAQPFSARCSKRSAARTNRLLNSLVSRRSTARASPSCWRRCANILSRSLPSISASSALNISSRDS